MLLLLLLLLQSWCFVSAAAAAATAIEVFFFLPRRWCWGLPFFGAAAGQRLPPYARSGGTPAGPPPRFFPARFLRRAVAASGAQRTRAWDARPRRRSLVMPGEPLIDKALRRAARRWHCRAVVVVGLSVQAICCAVETSAASFTSVRPAGGPPPCGCGCDAALGTGDCGPPVCLHCCGYA